MKNPFNFLANKVGQFANSFSIKTSQRNLPDSCDYGNDLQKTFLGNEHHIKISIYYKLKEAYMQIVEAARYCVNNVVLNGNEPASFYVLTAHNDEKRIYDITSQSDSLKSYLKQHTTKDSSSNDYLATVSYIMAEISKVSKDDLIIGYTFDQELADLYLNFKLSINTDNETLDYIWNHCLLLSSDNVDFLKKLLGDKYNSLSRDIIFNDILYRKDFFMSAFWKILKYQFSLGEPINERVYKLIAKFKEIQRVFLDGKYTGLNFNKEEQFAIIQRLIALGQKPDGTKYIDEVRTENGWLNEYKMLEKFKLIWEALDDETAEHAKDSIMERAREETEKERAYTEKIAAENAHRKAQIESTNAIINTQIAALKAEEAKLNAIYLQKHGALHYDAVDHAPIDTIRKQISELEKQLR